MYNYAPVLIITLNRYEHFKRCIESLSVNLDADKTDIFIALDYPLIEEHWVGYRKIVAYLNKIRGFKSINIINRNTNYGILENYFKSKNEILSRYDRIIFSEDDNEFSPDFLSFMNRCLDVYKDSEDVFSISGYNYPISVPSSYPYEIYKWVGHSAWGFGIWKDKWMKIDFSEDVVFKNIQDFLHNFKDVAKYNSIANHYIPALFHMLKQERMHGDSYICMYQYINNMYSIFPTVSRVRNAGHDGSGENCGYMESELYRKQDIYSGSSSCDLPFDIKPDEKINRILKTHFKRSLRSQVKTAAKLLLLNTGLYNPIK